MSVSLDDMIAEAVDSAVEKRLIAFEFRLNDIAERLGKASRALVPSVIVKESSPVQPKPEGTPASMPTGQVHMDEVQPSSLEKLREFRGLGSIENMLGANGQSGDFLE